MSTTTSSSTLYFDIQNVIRISCYAFLPLPRHRFTSHHRMNKIGRQVRVGDNTRRFERVAQHECQSNRHTVNIPIILRSLKIDRCKGISRLTVTKLNYDFFNQNFSLRNKDLKKDLERNKLKVYIINITNN